MKADPTATPTQIDVAWSAGFFDGEGCIVGQHLKRDDSYSLVVMLGQNDRAPLDALRGWFGGWVNVSRPGHWLWLCSGKRAKDFLRTVRPYLRVKGQRADLAIAVTAKELYAQPNRQATIARRAAGVCR